jgi:hypothetical protein
VTQPNDNCNEGSKEIRLDFLEQRKFIPIVGEIPMVGKPTDFHKLFKLSEGRSGKSFTTKLGHFNPIAYFGLTPDETLALLEKATHHPLSQEQRAIAKASALELLSSSVMAGKSELVVSDLVELWQESPALNSFAAALRRTMLPG